MRRQMVTTMYNKAVNLFVLVVNSACLNSVKFGDKTP